MKTEYTIRCLGCGAEFDDSGLPLSCPVCSEPALIRTQYKSKKLNVKNNGGGLYNFGDWLPLRRVLKGSAPPITYTSKHLGNKLGLGNLHITFSGYWPEKEAGMMTGTFKECEAYAVCGRMPEDYDQVTVVASAGNTARAFAKVCSENKIPLVVVIPEESLPAMWFENEIDPCVKLIAVSAGGDYFDAIIIR